MSHQEEEAKFQERLKSVEIEKIESHRVVQEELDLKAKHAESLEKRINERDAEFD